MLPKPLVTAMSNVVAFPSLSMRFVTLPLVELETRFEVDPTYGDPDPAAPESYVVYEAGK